MVSEVILDHSSRVFFWGGGGNLVTNKVGNAPLLTPLPFHGDPGQESSSA